MEEIKKINPYKNKIKYSFEQWCQDNNKLDLLDLWDYDLNAIIPSLVSYGSNQKKYYFKCQRRIHASSLHYVNEFTKPNAILKSNTSCRMCQSFGQYVLDEKGPGELNRIQTFNPELNLFNLSKSSTTQKIELQCSKMHPKYCISTSNYQKTDGCPYCAGRKVCLENSLGFLHPISVILWSDQNNKTPFDYTVGSKTKVYWKCNNGIHTDYLRAICNAKTYNWRCPECSKIDQANKQRQDLVGQTFGRLTVIAYDSDRLHNKNGTYWLCQCSCGSEMKSILGEHLKSGKIQSCGCLWKEKISGENNWLWKGGVTSENDQARTCYEGKEWIKEVYKKCFYTCQCCGESKHLIKNAHHIYNFAEYPNLRYDVNNGILLCSKCHSHTESGSFHSVYGTHNNTPAQLEEYINEKRKQLGIDIPFTIEAYKQGDILSPTSLLDKTS